MADMKPKSIVTIKAHGDVVNHARTDVAVRDLEITTDEPTERGGTNRGATPTETLVVALIGCTTVVTHRIADRLGIQIESMSVDVDADFDRRGVMQEEHLKVPFPKMELRISLTTAAPEDQVETLKQDLAKFCPLSNVIRESGTELTETWNISRP